MDRVAFGPGAGSRRIIDCWPDIIHGPGNYRNRVPDFPYGLKMLQAGRDSRPLIYGPFGIEFGRQPGAADEMGPVADKLGLEFAAALLPGADDHVVHFQQAAAAVHPDMQAGVVYTFVVHATDGLHVPGLEGGAMGPTRGLS